MARCAFVLAFTRSGASWANAWLVIFVWPIVSHQSGFVSLIFA
jgi:hypothetical protein